MIVTRRMKRYLPGTSGRWTWAILIISIKFQLSNRISFRDLSYKIVHIVNSNVLCT